MEVLAPAIGGRSSRWPCGGGGREVGPRPETASSSRPTMTLPGAAPMALATRPSLAFRVATPALAMAGADGLTPVIEGISLELRSRDLASNEVRVDREPIDPGRVVVVVDVWNWPWITPGGSEPTHPTG